MRYPDGGGLSPAARGRRETLRMQAARLFAEDVAPVQVAARLRGSTKAAYQWRRRWRAGVWAHVKRDLGNLLAGTVDELAASAKRLLKRIQYRDELIDGFRAQTGLTLDPHPP